MATYTHNPDVAHLFELDQQVRRLQRELESLHDQLKAQRQKTYRITDDYRKARKVWADVATDEINRATAANVDRIKNQDAYIAFLERHQP